jgi:glycosyltransferase involved in cell wall biosynthesis
MKISIFSAFPPFRGGISQFSMRLSEKLEKEHELQIITFKSQYPNWLFPGKSQFDFNQKSTLKSIIHRKISTLSWVSYLKTVTFIKQHNPELFITNYWMTFFSPFMGFIARRLPEKTKKIAIVHNLTPHEKRFFDSALNAYFLKSYDGFIALSQHVYDDLKKSVDKKKIILLPHPPYNQFGEKVDRIQAQKDLNLETGKKTLLFFGIIRKYKGLDLLIEAFHHLDNSYQLIIAGEVYGKDEEIQNLIDKNQNKERIHFFNQFIPDDKVSLFFSATDFLVLPYRSGTQSGVAAIAKNYNTPIIATNTGGITEKLDLNRDVIINNIDFQSIKYAIELAFSQSHTSKIPMVRSNESNYTWEDFSEELIKFSESISK